MLRLLTFLSALFLASAAAATTLWVDAPRDGFLNLRTGPSTHYHVVGKMPHGSKVEVLHAPGKWYKVRHVSGAVGWAHSAFLSSRPTKPGHGYGHGFHGKPGGHPHGKPGGHDYGTPAGPDLWVHAPGYSGLNLREGPGSHYRVLMTMAQRDKVTELGRQGSWILVRHASGRIGWAHGDYLVRRDPGCTRGHGTGNSWDRDRNGHRDDHGANGRWDGDTGHPDSRKRDMKDAVHACAGQYGEMFNRCMLRALAGIR